MSQKVPQAVAGRAPDLHAGYLPLMGYSGQRLLRAECYERCLADLHTADEAVAYEPPDPANEQIGRKGNLASGRNFDGGKREPSLSGPTLRRLWSQPYELDRQFCRRAELGCRGLGEHAE
jgi:hypothetical protein